MSRCSSNEFYTQLKQQQNSNMPAFSRLQTSTTDCQDSGAFIFTRKKMKIYLLVAKALSVLQPNNKRLTHIG